MTARRAADLAGFALLILTAIASLLFSFHLHQVAP